MNSIELSYLFLTNNMKELRFYFPVSINNLYIYEKYLKNIKKYV